MLVVCLCFVCVFFVFCCCFHCFIRLCLLARLLLPVSFRVICVFVCLFFFVCEYLFVRLSVRSFSCCFCLLSVRWFACSEHVVVFFVFVDSIRGYRLSPARRMGTSACPPSREARARSWGCTRGGPTACPSSRVLRTASLRAVRRLPGRDRSDSRPVYIYRRCVRGR